MEEDSIQDQVVETTGPDLKPHQVPLTRHCQGDLAVLFHGLDIGSIPTP